VDDGPLDRRHPLDRDDRPEAETFEHRHVQAADVLRDVGERVGPLVARVLGGVGERPHSAGVEHDDERAAAHAGILAQRCVARGCALKYASLSRSADRCV
jgi:hypothetical protein